VSSNFPTSWQWTFQGGDPSTSTLQNPKVVFNSPGVFRVTLVASNALGSSPLKEEFITVTSEGLCNNFSNYKPEYSARLLKISNYNSSARGYFTGHNSLRSQAFSELYANDCGYQFISGATLRFGRLVTNNGDATVSIVVWNARGSQGGPGAVIERKEILYRQIQADIAANRATTVTFDRETPVFGRPFHVGFEINYNRATDTLAIISSADGEANNASSWIRNSAGQWDTYAIAFGANIALDIKASIGMNPSVQVAASKTLISPGEEVTLNARGASIFVWNAADGSLQNNIGPQIVVRPSSTTTYITTGSGLDLCDNETATTIYVREGTVTAAEDLATRFKVFPSPGTDMFNIEFEDDYRGPVAVELRNTLGQETMLAIFHKTDNVLRQNVDSSNITAGLYVILLHYGQKKYAVKWMKQ